MSVYVHSMAIVSGHDKVKRIYQIIHAFVFYSSGFVVLEWYVNIVHHPVVYLYANPIKCVSTDLNSPWLILMEHFSFVHFFYTGSIILSIVKSITALWYLQWKTTCDTF